MSTIKTQVIPTKMGYEVWYSLDGGQTMELHSTHKTMDNAVKETVSLKGHYTLLEKITRKFTNL
jgi:hypothetical protein